MFCVLFMCKCVLPPGVNPIAVDKYINININIIVFSAPHYKEACDKQVFFYLYRCFVRNMLWTEEA
jgi:hypothetical protein